LLSVPSSTAKHIYHLGHYEVGYENAASALCHAYWCLPSVDAAVTEGRWCTSSLVRPREPNDGSAGVGDLDEPDERYLVTLRELVDEGGGVVSSIREVARKLSIGQDRARGW
jgi:hypothetical protein